MPELDCKTLPLIAVIATDFRGATTKIKRTPRRHGRHGEKQKQKSKPQHKTKKKTEDTKEDHEERASKPDRLDTNSSSG
jgi:hypothetical protein